MVNKQKEFQTPNVEISGARSASGGLKGWALSHLGTPTVKFATIGYSLHHNPRNPLRQDLNIDLCGMCFSSDCKFAREKATGLFKRDIQTVIAAKVSD